MRLGGSWPAPFHTLVLSTLTQHPKIQLGFEFGDGVGVPLTCAVSLMIFLQNTGGSVVKGHSKQFHPIGAPRTVMPCSAGDRAGLPTQRSEPNEVRLGGIWPAPFHTCGHCMNFNVRWFG